ncbi:hypothetical protein IWQ60_008879 [Tieghemiomyces parasiticus]|uniref:J domain-containing protein n=1 Tax=Tieghemiomyces parasiticus TaxID=78921 RepID=A0A9W7ZUX9_9FUNG|nr:hypothetical protein IWQ60_008879 [Tieghemiomyces parasiticus]
MLPAGFLRRSAVLISLCLCFFVLLSPPSVRAWDEQDYEIFDLVDFLKKAQHGEVHSFYDILGVSPKAELSKINQAFRRKSLAYHPDKNPTVEQKAIFTRLGSVMKILRNPASRERYDFFMRNGVPVWRGTGYFYSRYRPGLLSVVTGLITFSALVQYLVQWLNHYLTVRKIETYRRELNEAGQPDPATGGEDVNLVQAVANQAQNSTSRRSATRSAITTTARASKVADVDRSKLTRRQLKVLEREEKFQQMQERIDKKEMEQAAAAAAEEVEALPEDPEEARYLQIQRHWAAMDPESVPKPAFDRLWPVIVGRDLLSRVSRTA